mgnify:FL=1
MTVIFDDQKCFFIFLQWTRVNGETINGHARYPVSSNEHTQTLCNHEGNYNLEYETLSIVSIPFKEHTVEIRFRHGSISAFMSYYSPQIKKILELQFKTKIEIDIQSRHMHSVTLK